MKILMKRLQNLYTKASAVAASLNGSTSTRRWQFTPALAAALCLLPMQHVAAQDYEFSKNLSLAGSPPVFNVYSLSADAEVEVHNDLMTANLVVQAEGSDAAELAESINETMAWAVEQMKVFQAISTETRDYQTRPRYDSSSARRIIGWYASQTLQLSTDDFEAAGLAIQTLQERLQVQGIKLSAKRETRRKSEDKLIKQALLAFKQRAELVQKSMNASGYGIIDVNITSDGFETPVYRERMLMDRASGAAVESAPAIEAGTSRVHVRVDGRIQLDK